MNRNILKIVNIGPLGIILSLLTNKYMDISSHRNFAPPLKLRHAEQRVQCLNQTHDLNFNWMGFHFLNRLTSKIIN